MSQYVKFIGCRSLYGRSKIDLISPNSVFTVKHSSSSNKKMQLKVPYKVIIDDVQVNLKANLKKCSEKGLNESLRQNIYPMKHFTLPNLKVFGKGHLTINFNTNGQAIASRKKPTEIIVFVDDTIKILNIADNMRIYGFITIDFNPESIEYLRKIALQNPTKEYTCFILKSGIIMSADYFTTGFFDRLNVPFKDILQGYSKASTEMSDFFAKCSILPFSVLNQIKKEVTHIYSSSVAELVKNQPAFILANKNEEKNIGKSSVTTSKQKNKIIDKPNNIKKDNDNTKDEVKSELVTDHLDASKTIIDSFRDYQKDLVKMMEYPVLSNLSDEKVSKFNDECVYFELRGSLQIPFEKFYSSWVALKNYAEITQDSLVPDDKLKNFNTAKQLLRVVLNEESTDNEKDSSIKAIKNKLRGVLPINNDIIDGLRVLSGLKEVESS